MDQLYEATLVSRPSFEAVGIRWEGTFEEAGAEEIPEGMTSLAVPALTYARSEHRQGGNIDSSYTNIFAWIENQGYLLHKGNVTHFEQYPMAQDPYSKYPEFTIMISVEQEVYRM
jgi:Bacterial transcription activator, effector binding domain.